VLFGSDGRRRNTAKLNSQKQKSAQDNDQGTDGGGSWSWKTGRRSCESGGGSERNNSHSCCQRSAENENDLKHMASITNVRNALKKNFKIKRILKIKFIQQQAIKEHRTNYLFEITYKGV